MPLENASENIFTYSDIKILPDPQQEYPTSLHDSKIPLIIDNGSYQCRVGWASDDKPRMVFKNVVAKLRGKKDEIQVGNDIVNMEVVRWQLKSQFDRNIVTQYDVQEQVFDHMFSRLGINTAGCVDHPIVMTEPVANPNVCRQQMSELLFECYHIPELVYGIDALYSLYNNSPDTRNGLVISCGYHSTYIMPYLNGRLDTSGCRRINVGGINIDGYMQRLLQLKYPAHLTHLTLGKTEEYVRTHCRFAKDYLEELDKWAELDFYEDNVHKIQLPIVPSQLGLSNVNPEQQKQKKEEQTKRLQEMIAKRRQEKLASEEKQLEELLNVQELEETDVRAYKHAFADLEIENREELQAAIDHLSLSVQRLKARIQGVDIAVEPSEKQKPVFDLLSVSDDSLTAEEKLAKKRQRILKCAYEGKMRAKQKQEEEKLKAEKERTHLMKKKETNFKGWLKEVRQRRGKLLETRNRRKQKRSDMSKRRTYASQQRMKIISQLARASKNEDDFGKNDDDWQVYRDINLRDDDSDSDMEQDKLEELEKLLEENDPEFQKEMKANSSGQYDIAEYYRLHLAVEQIRAPELLFQPSLLGFEQAGLTDTISHVLKKYGSDDVQKLVDFVYVTGSCASFPDLKDRLEVELLASRPYQSSFSIYTADNPVLDAWLGARKLACSPIFKDCVITRADYQEKGGEYLKEHSRSNQFFPSIPVNNT
ncbi:actin-related protein 5-like [Tubulanus polymorphus]|uniref:actin-related protein 5-like n=1 Tax=Tubulanus polymorphus TaxID=672921 RepID=UPI003DA5BF33